jgi:serine/threonine-protein kinase
VSVDHLPVALATGSDLDAAEDLRTLLRRRLRFLFPLLAVLFCVALLLLTGDRPRATWQRPSMVGYLLLSALLAGLIWSRRPFSLGQLRAIELVLVSILATRIIIRSYLAFWGPDIQGVFQAWRETGDERLLRERLAQSAFEVCLTAAIYIVAYGVCIPNTWWRCAIVVAFLWGIVPVMWVAGWVMNGLPLPGAWWLGTRGGHAFLDLTFAVALAVYGSHRVDTLRHQALQARRLGQYALRHRLGAGGMGEVYLADHVLLRRPCALKLIRPGRAGDPRNLQRFEREVRATATLTHPNAVQIFDYGRARDGTFYYVMEYLPGLTLEQLVQRHGPLPPGRAVHFLRQLCGALREAHAIGLIHRDIKPGNVIVCERGGVHDVAKLLDFGLVKTHFAGDADDPLTHQGTVVGTPAFLSPEQAGGDPLDGRSDIYSLGALAYFLLTGQPPFAGRSGTKALAAHLYEEPAKLSARRPDVPADLEAVVHGCLAKDRENRFPDVESLDAALAACCSAAKWTEKEAKQWWGERQAAEPPRGDEVGMQKAAPGTSFDGDRH